MDHPSCGSEIQAELEVLEVGSEIAAGPKLNRAIATLVGTTGDVPDFCSYPDLAIESLEALGRQAYIKPTLARKWVCLFDHDGGVAVTVPCKKEAHAAALALHFVLASHQSVVT